jgi:antitoxin ParD1/3/4
MNISLTPALDKFVADKVASGRYTSASEVVREALRLLEEQEQSRAQHLSAWIRELSSRLGSLDAESFSTPGRVQERLAARGQQKRAGMKRRP